MIIPSSCRIMLPFTQLAMSRGSWKSIIFRVWIGLHNLQTSILSKTYGITSSKSYAMITFQIWKNFGQKLKKSGMPYSPGVLLQSNSRTSQMIAGC